MKSPKSNLVSNVEALKGMGVAKVSDDAEVDNLPLQAVGPDALVLPDQLDKKPEAAAGPTAPATVAGETLDEGGKNAKAMSSEESSVKKSSNKGNVKKLVPLAIVAPAAATDPTKANKSNLQHQTTATAGSGGGGAPKTKKVSQSSAEAVLSVFASSSVANTSPRNGVADDGSKSTKPSSPQNSSGKKSGLDGGTSKRGSSGGGTFKWFRKSRKHGRDGDAANSAQPTLQQQQQQQQHDFVGRSVNHQHNDPQPQPPPRSPHTPRTPRNIFAVLRNPTPSEVTKETNDTPIPPPAAPSIYLPPPPAYTSPLQLQLWLGVVQKCVVKVVDKQNPRSTSKEMVNDNTLPAVHEEQVMSEDHVLPEDQEHHLSAAAIQQQQQHHHHHRSSSFYRHTRETGVYVDYSTFDDGESISSIDLLFKWLMCRDLTVLGPEKGGHPNQTGNSINTDDNVQVESDVSFDPDAQPRRRVLFSP